MNLSDAIIRVPRPFDAEKGREVAATVVDVSPEVLALCAGTAGCSPYLASLIEKESAWITEAASM